MQKLNLLAFIYLFSVVQPSIITLQGQTNVPVLPSSCDLTTQIFYQGACVQKTCLQQKLSQIVLTINFGLEVTGNTGKLSKGYQADIKAFTNANGGTYYIVTIRYSDDINNQLLSDTTNCVDFRVYNIVNAGTIDPTRKFITPITGDGQVPTWPIPTYTYVQTVGGQIQFQMQQSDVQSNCLLLTGTTLNQFNCFFELAFLVQGITQVSYYFCAQILFNSAVTTASIPSTTFTKLIQNANCNGQGNCQISITIPSDLLFCQDSTCAQTSTIPFFTLYLNRIFYMKHQISDSAFTSWYILNPQVTCQSQILTWTPTGSDINVQLNAGYNIYRLSVIIVSPNVLISAKGTLSPTQQRLRLLVETNKTKVVMTSRDTGPSGSTTIVTDSQAQDSINTQCLILSIFAFALIL